MQNILHVSSVHKLIDPPAKDTLNEKTNKILTKRKAATKKSIFTIMIVVLLVSSTIITYFVTNSNVVYQNSHSITDMSSSSSHSSNIVTKKKIEDVSNKSGGATGGGSSNIATDKIIEKDVSNKSGDATGGGSSSSTGKVSGHGKETGSMTINEDRLGDGCYHVFLDVGANVGVHGRFLFEPQQYPDAIVAYSMFGKYFDLPRDSRNICVFAFEPNPIHKERLLHVQNVYQDVVGLRYHAILAGVGISNEPLTFYRQDNGKNNDWAFSTISHLHRQAQKEAITVPTVHLSKWIKQHITNRIVPTNPIVTSSIDDRTIENGPKVVMKVDVEGYEYALLPDLMFTGALCDTVDLIFGEFHHHFADIHIPANTKAHLPARNVTAKTARRYSLDMRERFNNVRRESSSCRTAEFVEADDESYLFDTIPLPTSRAQFQYVTEQDKNELFCDRCPKCTKLAYGSSFKPLISCNERIEYYQKTYQTPLLKACSAGVKQGFCPIECDPIVCHQS